MKPPPKCKSCTLEAHIKKKQPVGKNTTENLQGIKIMCIFAGNCCLTAKEETMRSRLVSKNILQMGGVNLALS